MAEHQVTFDSGKQNIQWRIYLRVLANKQNWVFLFGLIVMLFVFRLEGIVLLLFVASLAAFGLTAIQINKRCRQPRIGTVTINETGVHAVFHDIEINSDWPGVKKIESNTGDLFFVTDALPVVVPREAFSDSESALEFCQTALGLWQANRISKRIQTNIIQPEPSSQSTFDAEQYLQDHDEQIWKELERKHKEQPSDTND